MEIYGKDVIEAYRGRELYENPPHLFAVSDAAYKAMKRRAKDTCIVISGLSLEYKNPTFVCFLMSLIKPADPLNLGTAQ